MGVLVRLGRDRSGATAVIIAVCMTVLMAFAAMAIDAVHWYGDRREVQNSADAAAFSAAKDYSAGFTSTQVTAGAKAVTAQYGLTDGSGGVTVAVNMPPSHGPNISTPGAVEVIVNKTESLFFSSFTVAAASVKARAVAVSGSTGGLYCVLALSQQTASSVTYSDLYLNNGTQVDLSACGLADDASGPDALYMTGGATLKAKDVTIVGNYSVSNGATLTVTDPVKTSQPVTADPYAGVAMPTIGACTYTNASYTTYTPPTNPTPISAGTYCNGLNIANGNSVKMGAGVYIIDRGAFSIQGGVTVDASAGVTIILTSSTGSNWATANIANGTTFTLTAQSTGPYAGMAIIVDRSAPNLNSMTFAGGTQFLVTGAIYAPTQYVSFSNNSSNASTCTQLIAYTVNFAGGAKFGNQCSGVGTKGIGATATTLVE